MHGIHTLLELRTIHLREEHVHNMYGQEKEERKQPAARSILLVFAVKFTGKRGKEIEDLVGKEIIDYYAM